MGGGRGNLLVGVGMIEAMVGGEEWELADENGKEGHHGREGRWGSSPVKWRGQWKIDSYVKGEREDEQLNGKRQKRL